MRVPVSRRTIRLGILVGATLALVVAFRSDGVGWLASLVYSPLLALVAVVAGLEIRLRINVRRVAGLREWNALYEMCFTARRKVKIDFDRKALRVTRGADDAVLVGYATVLVNLVLAQQIGPRPSSENLAALSASYAPAWTHLVHRDPVVLDNLLRAACRYQVDGFPEPTWDTCRGLAALAGTLAPATVIAGLRQSVMTRYAEAAAKQQPSAEGGHG